MRGLEEQNWHDFQIQHVSSCDYRKDFGNFIGALKSRNKKSPRPLKAMMDKKRPVKGNVKFMDWREKGVTNSFVIYAKKNEDRAPRPNITSSQAA